MFEGRKARKLGLRDLGKVEPINKKLKREAGWVREVGDVLLHTACNKRVRVGKKIETGKLVRWCPNCEVITEEFND